jgi:lipopolysaccharide biosynthesis protein
LDLGIHYTFAVITWRSLRRSFELFRHDRRSWPQFARAWRYRVDRNALRFTTQTIKPLSPQPDSDSANLVFFAHFDPKDTVDSYVVYYVRALKELGSDVIFVSGSPNLSRESAAALLPYCAGIFTQPTLGMDFGSWNMAWQHVRRAGWGLAKFERLILANDSVYGPLFPLSEMLQSFRGADLYGATESFEIDQHLQSYFLVFSLNPRMRQFLENFWNEFRYIVEKRNLIDKYEIGLTQRVKRAGLRVAPYISHAAVQKVLQEEPEHQFKAEALGREVNNTLYVWDLLISHLRFPFLKTDLPKNNRYGSSLLNDLEGFLRRHTSYPPELITNHLASLRDSRD